MIEEVVGFRARPVGGCQIHLALCLVPVSFGGRRPAINIIESKDVDKPTKPCWSVCPEGRALCSSQPGLASCSFRLQPLETWLLLAKHLHGDTVFHPPC